MGTISLVFNSHVCLNWHLPPLFETTDIQWTKYLTNLVLLVPNVSYGTWFFPLGFLVEKTWSITYSKRCHWISNNYQKTRDKCISDKEPRQSHPWINFKRLKWRTCNIILPQLSPEWIVWMWLSKQIQLKMNKKYKICIKWVLKISLWIPQDACEEYVKNNDEDLHYKKKLGLKHQCLIRQFSHHQGKHPLFKQ